MPILRLIGVLFINKNNNNFYNNNNNQKKRYIYRYKCEYKIIIFDE